MSKRLQTRFQKTFLKKGFDMILNYLEETVSGKKPVINFHLPS